MVASAHATIPTRRFGKRRSLGYDFRMIRLICAVTLSAVLAATAAAAGDENDTIIAAARSYVASNSAMTTVTVTVEQLSDDFARLKVTPTNANSADPAWVFLKKKDGKWTGIALGTSFTTEDYQQMGIPNALRIP